MRIEIGKNPDNNENIVQIQIKNKTGKKSKSFTIHNTTISEVFHKTLFLFEELAKTDEEVTIIHHKWRKNGKEKIRRPGSNTDEESNNKQ